MRLDQYIVSKGWASSRTKAQEMIERGDVTVAFEGKAFPIRSSLMVDEETMRIDVKSDLEKYVSRAGFKMENALEKSGLNVTGKNVLDIGISTGGFSDCLLQKGAAKIVGVDVGRDQLHPLLLNDSRVTNFEQL
ncbi:MAG: SAM-dependent methyltransferase, partial [Bdellovibrionota bacterium]